MREREGVYAHCVSACTTRTDADTTCTHGATYTQTRHAYMRLTQTRVYVCVRACIYLHTSACMHACL